MLLGQENLKNKNGDIYVRSYYNFDHVWQANQELKKEIGNGITGSGEMRHVLRIPVELEDCDPLVKYALQGDQTCRRLMVAKYQGAKVCTGNL